MQILHVHSGNIYGGVETFLLTLAQSQGLVEGLHHSFALSFDGQLAARLRETSCKVYILGAIRTRLPLTLLRARRRLARIWRNHHFDTVVCHSTWSLALLAPAIPGPYAYYVHDILDGKHWLDRMASRRSPFVVVANSEFTRQAARRIFPAVPSTVVHPPSLARPIQPKPRNEKVTILQASRIDHWKGHTLLLDGLGRLAERDDWRLQIAGSYTEAVTARFRGGLVQQAARLGIDKRIEWLGFSSDVPGLMRAADIYCQPNLDPEPFGLTFIEALQAGTPVVSTSLGGPTEIIDATCGILCKPNDPDELAAALLRLIIDPELRRALGCRGPARAAELCDAETQTRALLAALSSIS